MAALDDMIDVPEAVDLEVDGHSAPHSHTGGRSRRF